MTQITPVLLSGGSGTRLWPMSRTLYPKQLLPLVTQDSMLVDTARRFVADGFSAPMVICNEEHRFIVAEQLRKAGIEPSGIVLEPFGRNTAPAAAVAALVVAERDPQGLVLLQASDHAMSKPEALVAAVRSSAEAAKAGFIVTFGITPSYAETGYGYIQCGQREVSPGVLAVERFVEKPDKATAERYLQEGDFVWNASLFLYRADTFLAEMERHNPAMLAACRKAVSAAKRDLDFLRLDSAAFQDCPSDSIDYAVMEKTDRAAVTPVDPGWSDVGAWGALWDIGTKDDFGNVRLGDTLVQDVRGSYLRTDGPMIAAVGVQDMVVVATKDAVLVAPRDRAQDVKKIVEQLKAAGRSEPDAHMEVFRPWGSYESIDQGERFQVKHITVKPGGKLSLQMHHHRAEHWIVVQGTARVTRGDTETLLFENQSIYIPMGEKHRLENPGMVPLHLIEVQSGSYLGEDDIVRFSDQYGRG